MMKRKIPILISAWAVIVTLLICLGAEAKAQNAHELVEKSFNYMRGKTSTSMVDMTIHRPGWERVMTIQAWTKGQEESIFWIR